MGRPVIVPNYSSGIIRMFQQSGAMLDIVAKTG